jgi:hypothetical protein
VAIPRVATCEARIQLQMVANLLAFCHVRPLVNMTYTLQRIQQTGHTIDLAALATFNSYYFGNYALNPNRLLEFRQSVGF